MTICSHRVGVMCANVTHRHCSVCGQCLSGGTPPDSHILLDNHAAAMTKKGKGGRPAWEEREGDPRVLYTANLYQSQLDLIKELGGAEWLRATLDRVARRRAARRRQDQGEGSHG